MAALLGVLFLSWWSSFVVDVCRPTIVTSPMTVARATLCADHGIDEGLYAAVLDSHGEPAGILYCSDDIVYVGLQGTGILSLRTLDQLESVILQNACGLSDELSVETGLEA